MKKATAYIQKLKLDKLIEVKAIGGKRQLEINVNQQVLGQLGKLDGCYVIKTDLTDETTNKKEEIHSRYKSLALVEWAFRTEKSQIEIRPVYLRKGHRTKGHLIVCMLVYKIEKYLRECWKELDITVEEGIEKLKSVAGIKTRFSPTKQVIWIPEPDALSRQLLDKAKVVLPTKETTVSTKEKLTKHRK